MHPAFFDAEGDDPAEHVLGREDVGLDDGLADLPQYRWLRQIGGVVDLDHLAVGEQDLVDHGGGGGDEVEVVLPLQPLLDDLHVQHAEEAAAEAEAQGLGDFRLVEEGGVVEAQLAQGVTQFLVGIGLHRIEAGKDPGLHLLEAWQGTVRRTVCQGNGIPHRGAVDFLDPRHQVANLASSQGLALQLLGGEDADTVRGIGAASGHDLDFVAAVDGAVDHPHQGDHPHVGIEPGVNDQGLEGCFRITLGRRDALDQGVQ